MQILQQPICPNKAYTSPTLKRKEYYSNVIQETELQGEFHASTGLTISCEFHGKTTDQTQNSFNDDQHHHAIVVLPIQEKISAMKYYTKEEEQEEKEKGVSTKLKLYNDPWKIKKKLTISDLGHLSRLLVKTELIKDHVFPFWSDDCINQIEGKKGADVVVWDQDTMSEHLLILKLWLSSKSYVFIGNWTQEFVKRRDLKEGDEIGFYWDPYSSRFHFTLLQRAPVFNQVN